MEKKKDEQRERKNKQRELIDRRDAIGEVLLYYAECIRDGVTFFRADEIQRTVAKILFDLPAVSKAPQRGKWVPYEFGDETWRKCTACGVADKYISEHVLPNGTVTKNAWRREYCPHCGAKMEE